MRRRKTQRSDHDTAWKELLQRYFEAFAQFFYPDVHAAIDWTHPPTFDEKELRSAIRYAGRGKRTVDVLAKVRLRDGTQGWVFVHVEIQNQVQPNFGQRMFECNALLFLKHKTPVISLGVLGDTQQDWRPRSFEQGLCGCRTQFESPIVKLLDYDDRWEELE